MTVLKNVYSDGCFIFLCFYSRKFPTDWRKVVEFFRLKRCKGMEQSGFCNFFISYLQASLSRCGLIVSSPVHCFSPGWRFPPAFFEVFRLNSEGAKECKSKTPSGAFEVWFQRVVGCKSRLRHSRERFPESSPKNSWQWSIELDQNEFRSGYYPRHFEDALCGADL